MVLIGYEMIKNVYEKTEDRKKKWVRKKKNSGTKRLETIVKIYENVSMKILPQPSQ